MQKGYRCVNGLILKIIAMAAMLATIWELSCIRRRRSCG